MMERWRADAVRDLEARARAIEPGLKTHTIVRIGLPGPDREAARSSRSTSSSSARTATTCSTT